MHTHIEHAYAIHSMHNVDISFLYFLVRPPTHLFAIEEQHGFGWYQPSHRREEATGQSYQQPLRILALSRRGSGLNLHPVKVQLSQERRLGRQTSLPFRRKLSMKERCADGRKCPLTFNRRGTRLGMLKGG